MSAFVDFERTAIRQLAGPVLSPTVLVEVLAQAELVSLNFSPGGCGYMLTVRHPGLPQVRVVCHRPMISGVCDDFDCGFVVFLEDGELSLECHSWGEGNVPADVRDRDLRIEAAT